MAITSELISGTTILNEVESSNIVRTQYDTLTKKMIAAYRDYITPEMKPYTGSKALDDVHGTEVWQLIGGFDKSKNIFIQKGVGIGDFLIDDSFSEGR